MNATIALALAGAYLAGSIPFGPMLARMRGVDLRAVGSGNVGATNVARALGKRAGAVVLLLDALKGALAVVAAQALDQLGILWLGLIGLAAIIGHCFPPWLGFRGGKGVATALGVFVVLDPIATGGSLIVFALAFAVMRRVSAGSLAAALSLPLAQLALGRSTQAVAVSLFTLALLVLRHRDNIERLLARREHGL